MGEAVVDVVVVSVAVDNRVNITSEPGVVEAVDADPFIAGGDEETLVDEPVDGAKEDIDWIFEVVVDRMDVAVVDERAFFSAFPSDGTEAGFIKALSFSGGEDGGT